MKTTRHNIFINITAAVVISIFASGCKENEPVPVSIITTDNYTGLDHLDIEYNGNRVVGKSASFFQEDKTAYVTLYSEIKPSELSDRLSFLPALKGPGALPGSTSITIPVYLQQDGQQFTFSGSGKTDFISYDYSGSVSNEKLNINFNNAKLINTSLAGIILEPTGFIPTGTILDDLVKTKIIQLGNNKYSIDELLSTIVRTISFNPDGNVVVTYIKTADGAPQPAQCPLTMLQYVPLSGNSIRLYINPTDLIGQIILNNPYHPDLPDNPFGEEAKPRSGDQDDTNSEITEALTDVLSQILGNGLPLEYTLSGTDVSIFLDLTPTASILSKYLPVLKEMNPELMQKLEPILIQFATTKPGFTFRTLSL